MKEAAAQNEQVNLAAAYQEFDRSLRVRQAVVGSILCLVLVPAGISLDYFVYPHLLWAILKVRLLSDVFSAPCLAVLFTAIGRRYIKVIGNLWAVPPTLVICWMIYSTDGVESLYYAGL